MNDNVDTENGIDDLLPFKNIMAERHARDTSRKIRTVFNARTQDGKRVQQVDIHLDFIGKFDAPAGETTRKVLEAEQKREEKRRKMREYQRRYRERKQSFV